MVSSSLPSSQKSQKLPIALDERVRRSRAAGAVGPCTAYAVTPVLRCGPTTGVTVVLRIGDPFIDVEIEKQPACRRNLLELLGEQGRCSRNRFALA